MQLHSTCRSFQVVLGRDLGGAGQLRRAGRRQTDTPPLSQVDVRKPVLNLLLPSVGLLRAGKHQPSALRRHMNGHLWLTRFVPRDLPFLTEPQVECFD